MFDVLGESKDTNEKDGNASGRASTLLGTDMEVRVVVANAARRSPLSPGSDGVDLWGEAMSISEDLRGQ